MMIRMAGRMRKRIIGGAAIAAFIGLAAFQPGLTAMAASSAGTSDAAPGTIDRYGLLHVLSGQVTKLHHVTLTLTGDETLYGEPSKRRPAGAALAPQTVQATASDNGFYQIRTWLGDEWIAPKHKVVYNLIRSKRQIRLSRVTPIFAFPNAGEPTLGALAPQSVGAFEQAAGGWLHIHTWRGDGWINPNISIPETESVQHDLPIIGPAYVRRYPDLYASILALLPSTPVTVLHAVGKADGGWYKVRFKNGIGWVQVADGDLPQPTDQTIRLSKTTELYRSPAAPYRFALLAPQQVHADEQWHGTWVRIPTWAGEAWIQVPGKAPGTSAGAAAAP